ncbi:MAG: cadherin domain-containing protein, partial [Pseudomonadota bacterium]
MADDSRDDRSEEPQAVEAGQSQKAQETAQQPSSSQAADGTKPQASDGAPSSGSGPASRQDASGSNQSQSQSRQGDSRTGDEAVDPSLLRLDGQGDDDDDQFVIRESGPQKPYRPDDRVFVEAGGGAMFVEASAPQAMRVDPMPEELAPERDGDLEEDRRAGEADARRIFAEDEADGFGLDQDLTDDAGEGLVLALSGEAARADLGAVSIGASGSAGDAASGGASLQADVPFFDETLLNQTRGAAGDGSDSGEEDDRREEGGADRESERSEEAGEGSGQNTTGGSSGGDGQGSGAGPGAGDGEGPDAGGPPPPPEPQVGPPQGVTLEGGSVAEGAQGAVIGALTAIAQGGGRHVFSVDDPRFEVVGDTLKLRPGQSLDFETLGDLVSLNITVTGPTGLSATSSVSFTLTDVDEFDVSPVSDLDASADQVSEVAGVGASVGVIAAASDADGSDTVRYSLSDSAGGRFAIDPETGVVTVARPDLIDFEADESHAIEILARSSDGSISTRSVTIEVTDAAEHISLGSSTPYVEKGVAELSVTGTGGDDQMTGGSGDDTFLGAGGQDDLRGGAGSDTLSGGGGDDLLEGGAGADRVMGGDGASDIAVFSGLRADYAITENAGVYTVVDTRPGAPDGVDEVSGVEIYRFLDGDVALADLIAAAPTDLDYGALSVSETAGPGASLGAPVVTDSNPSNTFSFELLDDAGGAFVIDPGTGELRVANPAALDFEVSDSVSVTVRVTDSDGLSYDETVTLAVGDEAETLSVSGVFVDEGVAETSITGSTGADDITANADGGVLLGGAGDDTLQGQGGSDLLEGGSGDDKIDGGTMGGGADVAVFSGQWSDYQITESGGVYTLADRRGPGFDGTDEVSNVEIFRFSDGAGGTVDVAVADLLNDGPAANDDSASIAEDAASVSGDVLANDTDPDIAAGLPDRLTVAEVAGVSGNVGSSVTGTHGDLTLNGDGSYSYTLDNSDPAVQALNIGDTLTDTFSYTVTDEHGATSTATLTITVTGTNDGPVANADAASIA